MRSPCQSSTIILPAPHSWYTIDVGRLATFPLRLVWANGIAVLSRAKGASSLPSESGALSVLRGRAAEALRGSLASPRRLSACAGYAGVVHDRGRRLTHLEAISRETVEEHHAALR